MGTLSRIRNARLLKSEFKEVVSTVPVTSLPVVEKELSKPIGRQSQKSPTDETSTVPTTSACPCRNCGSYLAWESIYRDGVLRCDQCSPAPSPAVLGGWWGLVEGSEINSRFAWVPVVFEGAVRREALAKDRYGNAPHSSCGASSRPPATFEATDAALALLGATGSEDGETSARHPHWSNPDADGWCWGVDVDGTLHMRRRQFVESGVAAMGEGLAWLGETEEEWRARMRKVDEVWRERGG